MKKIKSIVCFAILAGFTNVASATLLDFNDGNNLGVTLGDGSLTWSGIGGGHLWAENTLDDDSMLFYSTETYVNSFEMNAMAWLGFNNGNIGSIDIAGFNASDLTTAIWEDTVDLTNYTDWNNWLTVSVETAGITQLTFFATGNGGFWPSIDNMIINEPPSQVPLPAAIWLFGSGLVALFAMGRSRRQRT